MASDMGYRRAPLIALCRHRLAIDGTGVVTLVAFHGCTLRCKYCLNSTCLHPSGIWEHYTTHQLLEEVKVDHLYFVATGGGVTFGGGEPLLRSLFIKEFCEMADKAWNVSLETSLQVPLFHLKRVFPFVNHYFVDVKDTDADIYRAYTGGKWQQVSDNLQWLAAQGAQDKVTIRVPLIPDFNTPAHQTHSRELLERMGFTSFDVFDYAVR